ncbi:hypothetical protein EDB84DRAFT_141967 [Lactarius hengduanensis]|nr:hypothetical protein EDB84DRAFT_141967 [Lactarius hengduanensis]
MMREELEQELDEGRNLDLDSDIGDEDRIIGWIQVASFLPLRLLSEADALLPQDFLDENDDIFRAKDREQRTAFWAVYNGAQASARARANHRRRRRHEPIYAEEEEVRQKGAQCNPTGGGVRQPRDGRRTHSALRARSRERSNALAPADGVAQSLSTPSSRIDLGRYAS